MASFYQRYLVGTPSLSANYTISGCLSFSPIPLILSEAFLSPLQFTLTHFALSSYERALRLPTIISILGLDIFIVIPSDFIFSYKDLAFTHQLTLYPSPGRFSLIIFPFLFENQPSFSMDLTIYTLYSHSDSSLFRQNAALAYLDTLLPHNFVIFTDGFVACLFGKEGSDVFTNSSLC